MTNYIKKLLALAVTVGAMTAVADTVAYEGDYAKFSYSKIVNWRGTAAAFHNGTVTELQADGSESASYNMTADQGAQSWQRFAENQTAYACPGMVLRLYSSTATKNIEAAFSPWTIGGLIIEEAGYTLGPSNHNGRGVCFGDPSGETETYMDIHESFTINRGSTEANYKNGFFGTVNLTIDEGKVFNYNAAQSAHALYVHTQWTRKGTAVASHLKMHGEGTLKVATLTATGDVTLDFSDLGARANATPFIDGNLTLDDSTRIIFPAAIGSGVPMRLCSGTLNYSGEDEYTAEVQIGDTIKTATIQYDVSNASVKYILPVEDCATPVFLLNVYDTSHSEVTGWLNHTQTKDTTDSPKIPKNGDYLGTADGVHFSTTSGGNFFNNHTTANTDFATGNYVGIFGETYETLAEEVTASLGLPEGTVFNADIYKSGIMNGGVNNHTATIANLDTEKTYVVYIGTGLLKSDNTASNSGITVTEASYGSIGSIDYAMTVAGSGGTVAPNYQTAVAGTALKPGKNGLLVVRLTDVTPKDDGTITFSLSGDRAGLNFVAVAEVTRNTPTKLSTTLTEDKSWSELTWTADGKTQKWIDGVAAEIEVTDEATLTLDPTVNVKTIKFTGSYPLTLTTADGTKPAAEFLAKLRLDEYTGTITYGWNTYPTVIAINFNATANDNGDAGGSDDHKIGTDERVDILGMYIKGSYWSQFMTRTQSESQAVTAYDTATGETFGTDASVTWRSDNVYMYRSSEDKVIRGYLDDGGQHASVNISDIPFAAYDLIIVCATDQDSRSFNPVTVNGTKYRWDADEGKTIAAETGTWGRCRGAHVEYGLNAIKIDQMTARTLSIVGGANANNARGGIAAVLLVQSATGPVEIVGDTTMADLAAKLAGQEDAIVTVVNDAAITQDGTTLGCASLTLRADEPKTLSFALTADQLAAVAALAPNSEYDVLTAVFGFKPTLANVKIAITNVPTGLEFLEVAGQPTVVRPASEVIFTLSNEDDWMGHTVPFYAKTLAATGNTSFAGNPTYLQTLDSGDATVAVVTTAPAASRIYGLVALTGDDHGLGAITRDVYLKVSGGTPGVISGGEDATWSGDKTNPTGNILVNITGNTVVDYVYGAGLGGGTGGMLAKIDGNIGIVVDGDAQILGTLAAGWQSRHAATPEVTGNTSVLIKNVQTHATDATLDGNPNCVQGWILGGGIFKVNGGCCKIGGNSSVTVDLANSATGEFMKMIAGGGHNEGAGDGENTLGNSSVTINAPDTVTFSKKIVGGGHSTGTNKAKTGVNSSVTLNGGTYTSTIYAAGDNGDNTLVSGSATVNLLAGDFTAATLQAGAASGAKTLNVSGGKVVLTSAFATGFDTINFTDGYDLSFQDGWGASTPVTLSCTTMSVNGVTTGEITQAGNVKVGSITISNATLVYNLDAHTVYYTVPKSGTLTRRSDADLGIDPADDTDEKRNWTYAKSWLDADGNQTDWPMSGAAVAVINADEVSSIRVDARISADMINLTNTAAQEAEPSFKFLTKEPLDEVADMTKTNPEYVILGKLSATAFRGDLYLQSRITQSVALGADTHVFFVAWNAAEETTAYPYEFSNMVNPICKVGPGAFIVPSSMYTYSFNVKGGSLIYDIAASAEEVIVSGDLKKDTPADPEAHLLIKRGAGTMIYTRKELVNFLDGLEVRAGTFKLSNTSGDYAFWNTTTPASVTVKSGATLEMNGKGGFAANVTLEGGATLANTPGGIGTGSASLRSITLTGNATVNAAARFGLLANGYGATKLNLGGHTLTKTGAEAFHLCNVSSDEAGTIDVRAGTIHTVQNAVSLPNVNVILDSSATFDVGAATTLGGLTLGPTYNFIGSSTLTIAKTLAYAGPADSVFTWYTANLAEGATFAFPSTAFTMKFPTIPTTPVTLPSVAKVELSVPNLSVGYVYPIVGVAKENVIVKVNGEVSSAANVEVDATSIKILPPLSRPNPVTGEYIGFNNVFRGTEDANWATSGNWYTGNDGAWVQWSGTAPMLPNTADGGFNPTLIAGDMIGEASRREITLATMEGWNPRLGLYNGVNVTVATLNKIQRDAPSYIMVDATSKLTIAAPSNSKSDPIDLAVASEGGITWSSAFSAGNALSYYFTGAGSVNFAAGVTGGTHTIKRFDLTIGDATQPGMQRGIVSKKLVAFGATSSRTFTIAADAVVGIFDSDRYPLAVAAKSPVDALSGNEDLGTYYIVQTEDGVYVKYIGYTTDPEQPTQTIIDQNTTLSAFFTAHPSITGQILVVGKATSENAFTVTVDRAIPEGVSFSVSGHADFAVGGSVTEIPVAPITLESGASLGIAAPLDSDYTIAAGCAVRIVRNMTLTHNLRPTAGSGIVEIAPGVTLTEGANTQIGNNGIFRIYGTLDLAGFTHEWNSHDTECKVYLYAGGKITGTDAARVKTTGGYSATFFIKDFDGAAEKVATMDVATNHGSYDVAINYVVDPGVGFKFLRNTENTNLTVTGTNIPYLEVAGNANMKVANNAACLTGAVKTSGTAALVLQGDNAFASTANVYLPATINTGSTTQSFNATMTVESGSGTVPDFVTDTTVIKKMGAGELVMGDKRPVMNVVEGSVRVTASFAEITAGELVLNVTPDAAPGEGAKVTIVDGSGSEIGIKGEPVVDPVAHTVTITLATATINESKTMSEIKSLFPDGGAIAITGSSVCDDSVTITLDAAVPANYSFTVSGHVTFAVSGSIAQIPLSKITLNENACLVLKAPIAEGTMTIDATRTIKTHANQTIKLTNNGTFVVKTGATVTATASAGQAIKGVVTIEKGATFVNQTNDAISYGTPGTTVNVYGTLAMGGTRWTVGGQSAINLYGSARVTGEGSGDTDSAGVLDIFRSGNTISVYNVEGEDPATATIEGVVRVRNTDGGIWIATGASLALPGGLNGIVANAKVTLRQGDGHTTGHLTGTIPLRGSLTLDYGSQQKEIPAHFEVKSGTVKLHVTGTTNTDNAICVNDSEDDPFIKILDNATLELDANNLSGSLGSVRSTGWIVNHGTLVFMDGNGGRFFRDHLVLEGGTVKINGGDRPVILYGGAESAATAQIRVRRDSTATIVEGSSGTNNKALSLGNDTETAYGTPGAGVFVDEGGKLTISAPILGKDPLVKWGTGTLNIGLSRPTLGKIEGVVEVEVSNEEAQAFEVRIPTTMTAYDKEHFSAVGESGAEVGISKVTVVDGVEEGERVAVLTLEGNIFTVSTRTSLWLPGMKGVARMQNESEEPITLYVDDPFPEGVTSIEIVGNIKIVVEQIQPSYGTAELFLSEGSVATVSGRTYPFVSARGVGELVFDPGENNTWTVSADNSNVTNALTIASGTIKMGNFTACLGKNIASRYIYVNEGATLDINGQCGGGNPALTAVLRGGTLMNSVKGAGVGDDRVNKTYPITTIRLKADSFVKTEKDFGLVGQGHSGTSMYLEGHTLTKLGTGYFDVCNTRCYSGGGRIKIEEGIWAVNANGFTVDDATVEVGANGRLRVESEKTGNIKNIVAYGTVDNAGTLNVSGTLSGTGRIETGVSLTNAAKLKVREDGALTINGTLASARAEGAIVLDCTAIDTALVTRIPVVNFTNSANVPAVEKLSGGPARWRTVLSVDGLGYKLVKPYLALVALSSGVEKTLTSFSSDFEAGELPDAWEIHTGVDAGITETAYTYEAECGYPMPTSTHTRILSCADSTYDNPLICAFGQEVTGGGLYLDTMMQLTPAIDRTLTIAETATFALYACQETAGGAVKLYVRAGRYTFWTNTVEPYDYDVTPAGGIVADSWHRVTVKMIPVGRSDYGEHYGFVVYLDGTLLTYAGKPATNKATGCILESLDPIAALYYDASAARNSLFPSLFEGNTGAKLAGLGVAGMGAMDDVVLTTTAPEFAKHTFTYTLTWDDGVESITANGEPIDLSTGRESVIELANVSETITFAATFKDGFSPDGWEDKTIAVVAGATVSVASYVKVFDVDGEVYPDTDTGRRAAIAAAMMNKKPLKLTADYANRQIYVEYPAGATEDQRELVLDLNGHKLGPIGKGPTIYVNTGCSLKIIDSTGAEPQVLASDGMATIRSHGPVTIENGTYEAGYEAGSEAAVFTFAKVGAKILKGEEKYFPYALANGLDATVEGDYWVIGTATQATLKFPAVKNATYAVTVDGTPVTVTDDILKVDFEKTVAITWTPDEGYRILAGGAAQTIMTSVAETQPVVNTPQVEIKLYTITYVYETEDHSPVTLGEEDVNTNETYLTAESPEITIDPEKITIEGYEVLAVDPETIAAGTTQDVTVTVTLKKDAPLVWWDYEDLADVPGLDEDLKKVERVTLITWAESQQIPVENAATILPSAFLLDCANTQTAIDAKTALFKFTAADLATLMAGEELTTLNGLTHNGKLVVEGSNDLKNWSSPEEDGVKYFWRASLTFKFVEVK